MSRDLTRLEAEIEELKSLLERSAPPPPPITAETQAETVLRSIKENVCGEEFCTPQRPCDWHEGYDQGMTDMREALEVFVAKLVAEPGSSSDD